MVVSSFQNRRVLTCCRPLHRPRSIISYGPHLGLDMPIRALLENAYPSAFGPEDIAALAAGFEAALSKLGLVDRKDPMTMTVAKLIIELAKNGERDPNKLCDDALKLLGK
jgi:hypothetical protein